MTGKKQEERTWRKRERTGKDDRHDETGVVEAKEGRRREEGVWCGCMSARQGMTEIDERND